MRRRGSFYFDLEDVLSPGEWKKGGQRVYEDQQRKIAVSEENVARGDDAGGIDKAAVKLRIADIRAHLTRLEEFLEL